MDATSAVVAVVVAVVVAIAVVIVIAVVVAARSMSHAMKLWGDCVQEFLTFDMALASRGIVGPDKSV